MDVAALRIFMMAATGWGGDQRKKTVAYLVEENRILRRQLRGRRLRLTDDERRWPTSWQTFRRAQRGAIARADFFTTEVWTWRAS